MGEVSSLKSLGDSAGVPDYVSEAMQGLASSLFRSMREDVKEQSQEDSLAGSITALNDLIKFSVHQVALVLASAGISPETFAEVCGNYHIAETARLAETVKECRLAAIDLVEMLLCRMPLDLKDRLCAANERVTKEKSSGKDKDGAADPQAGKDEEREGEE